jgi:hypothetical protein
MPAGVVEGRSPAAAVRLAALAYHERADRRPSGPAGRRPVPGAAGGMPALLRAGLRRGGGEGMRRRPRTAGPAADAARRATKVGERPARPAADDIERWARRFLIALYDRAGGSVRTSIAPAEVWVAVGGTAASAETRAAARSRRGGSGWPGRPGSARRGAMAMRTRNPPLVEPMTRAGGANLRGAPGSRRCRSRGGRPMGGTRRRRRMGWATAPIGAPRRSRRSPTRSDRGEGDDGR